MAVRVKTSEVNPDIQIAALSGRLDMAAAEADYPAVRQAIEQAAAGIVVDLGEVEFVSSAGFRMLLSVCQDAQAAGKTAALTRPRPSVYKIFKVAALDTRLPFLGEEVGAGEARVR